MEHEATGPEPTLGAEPFATPTAAERDQAERSLRQAMLHHQRNESLAYRESIEAAFAVAPALPEVIVRYSELLIEQKKLDDALAVLRRGLETHPRHEAIESAYGEAVLRKKGVFSVAQQKSDYEVMVQGKTAAILSALVPGSGQAVLGQWPKGLALFGLWVTGIIIAFSVPGGLSGLFAMVGLNRSGAADLNPVVLGGIFLSLVSFVVAVSDASSFAKRVERRAHPRPEPPVDKPFEL